jgi:hypothetical protein
MPGSCDYLTEASHPTAGRRAVKRPKERLPGQARRRPALACRQPPSIRNPQSPIRNQEIGFVSHVSLPGGPPPTRGPLPIYPSHPKVGFVLHDFLRHWPPAGGNWVCLTPTTKVAEPASGPRFRANTGDGFSLSRLLSDASCFAHFGPVRSDAVRRFSEKCETRGQRARHQTFSNLTLETSNLKLSARETIEFPFVGVVGFVVDAYL